MSKVVDVHLSQVRFPSSCVVCTAPSIKSYELRHIVVSGRKSYTVRLNIPVCERHFRAITEKAPAEQLVERLGVIMGALSGLAVTIMSLVSWQATEGVNVVRSLFAGAIFGLVTFLLVWAGISRAVAPRFAAQASREARHVIRFKRYWSQDQFVRLEFQDEALADSVRNTYRASPKPTRVSARTPEV